MRSLLKRVLPSGLRGQLRSRWYSAQVVALHLISFSPAHSLRLMSVRLAGGSIGTGAILYHGYEIRNPKALRVGARSKIGNGAILDARGGIDIGEDVNLSTGVHIWTGQHSWRAMDFAYESRPVKVGDRAWISARATLLPGTHVGEGAVVAAGAVVSGRVAPFTVVGGVPARKLADRPQVTYQLDGRKEWWW